MTRLFALVGLSTSWAAPLAELDGLALVQRMEGPSKAVSLRRVGRNWGTCTANDLASFDEEVKEWQHKLDEQKRMIVESKQAAVNKTVSAFRGLMLRLLTPFSGAAQDTLYMGADATAPFLKDAVKFYVQNLAHPDQEYQNYSKVKIYPAMMKFKEDIAELKQPVEGLLRRAITALDRQLDAEAQEFPNMQPLILDSRKLKETPTAVGRYLTEKILPIVLVETFPPLGKWIPLLARIPRNTSEIGQYFTNILLPVLPPQCQAKQAMVDGLLAKGSVADKAMAFVEHCHQALVPKDQAVPTLPKPVRHCKTCEEQLFEMMTSFQTSESCASHCKDLVPTCLISWGIGNKCLASMVPCVRCAKNRLQQFDTCAGTTDYEHTVTWLSNIFESLKGASVEEGSVDAFLDKASKALVKDTPLDREFLMRARSAILARVRERAETGAKAVNASQATPR